MGSLISVFQGVFACRPRGGQEGNIQDFSGGAGLFYFMDFVNQGRQDMGGFKVEMVRIKLRTFGYTQPISEKKCVVLLYKAVRKKSTV